MYKRNIRYDWWSGVLVGYWNVILGAIEAGNFSVIVTTFY